MIKREEEKTREGGNGCRARDEVRGWQEFYFRLKEFYHF